LSPCNFSLAQTRIQKPNGWPDSGGGGLEQVKKHIDL